MLGGTINKFNENIFVEVTNTLQSDKRETGEIEKTVHTKSNSLVYDYTFINEKQTHSVPSFGDTSYPFANKSYLMIDNNTNHVGEISYYYQGYSGALNRIKSDNGYYNFDYQYTYHFYTGELSSETNSYFGNISYSYDNRGNITNITRVNQSNPSLNKTINIPQLFRTNG